MSAIRWGLIAGAWLVLAVGCSSLPPAAAPNGGDNATRSDGEKPWVERTRTPIPYLEPRAGDDYTLGSEDRLAVRIDDLHTPGVQSAQDFEVSRSGKVTLPLAGAVAVSGMTVPQATDAFRAALQPYLRDPRVTIEISRYASKKILIQGCVAKPGAFAIPCNTVSVIEALSVAGGLSPSSGRNVVIGRVRNDVAEQIIVDLEAMLARGLGKTIAVEPGDVVEVPEAEKVYVIGYVYKPGQFRLDANAATAAMLVAQAGGPIPREASPDRTFIRRRQVDGTFRTLELDLGQVYAGAASDIELRSGDIVIVPQSGLTMAANELGGLIRTRAGSLLTSFP